MTIIPSLTRYELLFPTHPDKVFPSNKEVKPSSWAFNVLSGKKYSNPIEINAARIRTDECIVNEKKLAYTNLKVFFNYSPFFIKKTQSE